MILIIGSTMHTAVERESVQTSNPGGVVLKSSKVDTASLEEEYNKWLSKVNELSDKKNELSNSIKLK